MINGTFWWLCLYRGKGGGMTCSNNCAYIEGRGGGITGWREKPFDRWCRGGDHSVDYHGGSWKWHVSMAGQNATSLCQIILTGQHWFFFFFLGIFLGFFSISLLLLGFLFSFRFWFVSFRFTLLGLLFFLASGSLFPSSYHRWWAYISTFIDLFLYFVYWKKIARAQQHSKNWWSQQDTLRFFVGFLFEILHFQVFL